MDIKSIVMAIVLITLMIVFIIISSNLKIEYIEKKEGKKKK